MSLVLTCKSTYCQKVLTYICLLGVAAGITSLEFITLGFARFTDFLMTEPVGNGGRYIATQVT